MNKVVAKLFAGALIVSLPLAVNAKTFVNNEEELEKAINNTEEKEIVLSSDIKTTKKVNIVRELTIDGNSHSITYVGDFWKREGTKPNYTYEKTSDNKVWSMPSDGTGAAYVLQAYGANAKVTIKDITLAGGNRGLAINGANVTLDGSIIFENNGFQPIELSHGSGLASDIVSTLNVKDTTVILNLDESKSDNQYPYTLYVDDANGKLVKNNNGKVNSTTLQKGNNYKADQINVNLLYVNNDAKIEKSTFEQAKTNNQNIILTKTNDEGDITYSWAFESDKITDSSIDVNPEITFTKEAPQKLQASLNTHTKDLKNVNFLNFSHSGVLPGTATISYNVSDKYAAGTKLYVAHFKESTNTLETPQEVVVDADGYIEFDITECSSYVLYTGKEETTANTATEIVKPAKTGDINILAILSTITLASIGAGLSIKKLASKTR